MRKCLTKTQFEYVMDEIHRGICGMHDGGRTMVAKVVRVGFYWPTMCVDCREWAMKCNKCQRFTLC